jgi:UDP-N-acetylglucosamine 2-epimerase (non-hydrolysing)
LHRPSNVDDPSWLQELLAALAQLSKQLSIVFPVQPRTRQRLDQLTCGNATSHLLLLDPLPYLEFIALQRRASVVITDSGGIQEETTFLGVPCLTVRENTERPVTVSLGTNQLVGRDVGKLLSAVQNIVKSSSERPITSSCRVPLWDGHAA